MDIQGLGFPLTAELKEHTERRLPFAVTQTSARIMRVVVRLGDRNGPRGSADKLCRIQVVLEHALPVLSEDSGADFYAVIDRAAERAGRNVAKHIDRLRDNVRLPMLQRPASPLGDVLDISKK